MTELAEVSTQELAGKYLTFELGGEVYGLEILKVHEIMGMMNVTHVPRTPKFVRGVINLRGKVIPVVDLRTKFGLPSQEDTDRTCIVVVQVSRDGGEVTMGIIVDEVSEVMDVASDEIEPPPSFGVGVDTEFILGMGKVGQKVVMLLQIDEVLSSKDTSDITAVASESSEAEQPQEEQPVPQQ